MTVPDDVFPHLYPRVDRAAPRPDPAQIDELGRLYKAIRVALPLNAVERSLPELRLVLAVLHLAHYVRWPTTQGQAHVLEHTLEILGIELAREPSAGEEPR